MTGNLTVTFATEKQSESLYLTFTYKISPSWTSVFDGSE